MLCALGDGGGWRECNGGMFLFDGVDSSRHSEN